MIKILLCGSNGKMGQVVKSEIKNFKNIEIVAGVDKLKYDEFPVYDSFDKIKEKIDAIIDFSHPSILSNMLSYSIQNKIPAVICTTGLESNNLEEISNASKTIPILISSNMSIGISVLCEIVKKAAGILDDFDIEIIEKHHNEKIDAPSGTAYVIAEKIKQVLNKDVKYICGRNSKTKKRDKNEIGVHSIRGGNVPGEHSILFLGKDETLEIKHTASSKNIFAVGAIKAVKFLINKPPKLYTMDDFVESQYS